MLLHCGIHPVLYALLCAPYLNDVWVQTTAVQLNGWACICVLFIFHFVEDEWRVFMLTHRKLDDDTLYFLFDQSVHFIFLIALLPLGLWGRGDGLLPEAWPLIGALAVLATHGTTVLLYYFEKELFDGAYPEFDEKHYTIAERFIFMVCFLLPGFWGYLAPIVWGVLIYQSRLALGLDYSWFGFYIGGLCAGVCGLIAHWVWAF